MLALVLVDALHLNVEQAGRVHQHAGVAMDVAGQLAFHRQLGASPELQEALVVLMLFEFAQVLHVGDPVLTNMLIQQLGEFRVGQRDPAAGGDTVGDVGEFFWPEGCEFRQQVGFHQIGMQCRHTIHMVSADGGQMGHANGLAAVLVDDR